MVLGNLDNEVYFKKVFTDVEVFTAFVKDVAGIDINISKVETEKVLIGKPSSIKFKMDLFAESKDKRTIVEIQRVDYDHNFDRFIHYFLANLLDVQRDSKDYKFAKDIYMIVVITQKYIAKEKTGEIIKDNVLVCNLNPKTIQGIERNIFPHHLIFLNPSYPLATDTPESIKDWMNLISESINNPTDPQINFNKPAIKKAANLADIHTTSPEDLAEAKDIESRKEAKMAYQDAAKKEEREKNIIKSLKRGKLTIEEIAEDFEETIDYVQSIKNKI